MIIILVVTAILGRGDNPSTTGTVLEAVPEVATARLPAAAFRVGISG